MDSKQFSFFWGLTDALIAFLFTGSILGALGVANWLALVFHLVVATAYVLAVRTWLLPAATEQQIEDLEEEILLKAALHESSKQIDDLKELNDKKQELLSAYIDKFQQYDQIFWDYHGMSLEDALQQELDHCEEG